MKSHRPLSPELEETARILDLETRTKLHAHQDRMDRNAVNKLIDGDYSLVRLLHGLRELDVQRLAPYEARISQMIAERVGREPHHGYAFVPVDLSQRDMTAGVASAGGYLISTEVAPGNLFAEYLHASSVQGISRVAMVGNASIPKTSATISTFWQPTEGTALTESQLTFALEAATPKTVGSYCEISNQFLNQTSPVVQAFIVREQALATSAGMNKKLMNGSGANGEMTGVLNVSGVGSVSGTDVDHADVLDVIKNVENASGIVQPGRAGFVVAPDAARLLRSREKAAGSGMIMDGYTLAGFPAQVTKSTPDASLIFGDWSQLVLLEWGVLEVSVDPYGADGGLFKRGLIGLRTLWTIDAVCLHPESFNKIVSIT
jgi:HK97 family phage major capsid protein